MKFISDFSENTFAVCAVCGFLILALCVIVYFWDRNRKYQLWRYESMQTEYLDLRNDIIFVYSVRSADNMQQKIERFRDSFCKVPGFDEKQHNLEQSFGEQLKFIKENYLSLSTV